MSTSDYTPVSMNEGIEMDQMRTDADDTQRQSEPLTKRAIYSSHRIEARTPRLDGEDDVAYKRRITSQHINAIVHSIGWVLAALAIFYFTDLWNVVRYDQRVNRLFLMLGVCSGGVVVMVIAYLAVWVPMTAKRPVLDLNTYAPMAGPTGAIAGVATFVFFIIALWPIWQWVTIPIMIVLSFAACLGPNLLPI